MTSTKEEIKAAVATCTPDSSDVEDCDEQEDLKSTRKECQQETEGSSNDDVDDDDLSASIPEEFICPLTMEIFTDPLMDKRGMNWERSAILEWLNRGNTTCPLTREPMGFRSLIPNVNLRIRVEHWKKENGYLDSPSSKDQLKMPPPVVAYINAPPESSLELQWTQAYMQARAAAIVRRIERREQAMARTNNAAESSTREERNENSSRRGRRRRSLSVRSPTTTGYSPATQQRRLAGLLGDALSIVRRPPLSD